MHLLATTALEAMKEVPPKVWLKIGVAFAAIIIAAIVIPKVFKMNKIVLGVIVFVCGTIIFFSWVYNRTEPKFLTPLISRIAEFFPSANAYENKQKTTPKH